VTDSSKKKLTIRRHRFFNPVEGKEQFIIEWISADTKKTVKWYKRP